MDGDLGEAAPEEEEEARAVEEHIPRAEASLTAKTTTTMTVPSEEDEEEDSALSTVVARGAVRGASAVGTFMQYFTLWYIAACGVLIYQMISPVACTTTNRDRCAAPWLPLNGRMDLFVITTAPGERSNVSYAHCNVSARAPFTAAPRIHVPEFVRTRFVDLSAMFYARPASSTSICKNASEMTPNDVRRTSALLGGGPLALTEQLRTRRQHTHRNLLEKSAHDVAFDEPFPEGTLRPHWRFGLAPVRVRLLDVAAPSLGLSFLSSFFFPLRSESAMIPLNAVHEGLPSLSVDRVTMVKPSSSLRSEEASDDDDKEQTLRYAPIAKLDVTGLQRRHKVPMALKSSPEEEGNPRLRFSYTTHSTLAFGARSSLLSQLFEIVETIAPEKEADEIRRQFCDERVFKSCLTYGISWLHAFLWSQAFKEDVGFYVGLRRRFLRGVSASSLTWAFSRTLISWLYLLDAGVGRLVLFTNGLGVFGDAFKCYRVLRPTVVWVQREVSLRVLFFPFRAGPAVSSFAVSLPTLKFRGGARQQEESRQLFRQHSPARWDREAAVNIGLALAPALVGVAVYTLTFEVHKSWYSWLINALADASYFFGFLVMTPQIYVNYRLKSVAHLPMKAMLYKIFATFVDDAFAFIVDLPTKYRLMTLRDDVVFAVFIYQYFRYRTDKTRPNEFGFVYDQPIVTTKTAATPGCQTSGSSSSSTTQEDDDDADDDEDGSPSSQQQEPRFPGLLAVAPEPSPTELIGAAPSRR